MDFHVATQEIATDHILLDQGMEQTVDCELVLPDGCPDLSRVLKCKTDSRITAKEFRAGHLSVEGSVLVTVLYVDAEEGELRSHQACLNFVREVDVPGMSEECRVEVESRVSYLNCRVLTARKLDLHGAVHLHVTVSERRSVPILTQAEGCGMKLCLREVSMTSLADRVEKYISINEEVELDDRDGSVRCILRQEADIRNAECKAVGGRLVIKGDLWVCAVYCTETPRMPGRIEAVIPFSQILDLGSVEEWICSSSFEVSSLEMHPRTGLDGECKTILVSAVVSADVRLMETVDAVGIRDCYSTRYDVETERETVNGRRRKDGFSEVYRCQKTVELPVEVDRILDCWCECGVDSSHLENGVLQLAGRVNVCLLAADLDGGILYHEKPVETGYQRAVPSGEGLECKPTVKVRSAQCTLASPSQAQAEVELEVEGEIFEPLSLELIRHIRPDENRPKPTPEASLVIYYAHGGERLWDIAKRYNTDAKEIAVTNDLTGELLERNTMLLIPSV